LLDRKKKDTSNAEVNAQTIMERSDFPVTGMPKVRKVTQVGNRTLLIDPVG